MRPVALRAMLVRMLFAVAIAFSFASWAMAAGTMQSGSMQDRASVTGAGSAVSGHGPSSASSVRHAHDGGPSCYGGMTYGHCAPLPTMAIAFLVPAKEMHEPADSEGASSFSEIPHRPPNRA